MAYAWQFNGVNDYKKRNIPMLDYRVSGSARGIPFDADAQLIWRPGAGRWAPIRAH